MKENLLFMSMGNGITVCDKNRNRNNDYLNVAHIGYSRNIYYYIQNLTLDAITAIEDFAKYENSSISASQTDRYTLCPLDYSQFTFERLELLLNRFEQNYWFHEGGYGFDYFINDISRALVEKFHEKHGGCYLGKIKKNEGDTDNREIVKYEGQFIHVFQYDFIIPFQDENLMKMISLLNKDRLPRNPNMMQYSIFKRIIQSNGIFLLWANKPKF